MVSKLGLEAGKLERKVAQSKAGRLAGKAPIKEALDAAAEDLTDRYLGSDEPTPTQINWGNCFLFVKLQHEFP